MVPKRATGGLPRARRPGYLGGYFAGYLGYFGYLLGYFGYLGYFESNRLKPLGPNGYRYLVTLVTLFI